MLVKIFFRNNSVLIMYVDEVLFSDQGIQTFNLSNQEEARTFLAEHLNVVYVYDKNEHIYQRAYA